MEDKKNLTTFEKHLEARYGKVGTKERDEFELKARAFIEAEMIKEVEENQKLKENV